MMIPGISYSIIISRLKTKDSVNQGSYHAYSSTSSKFLRFFCVLCGNPAAAAAACCGIGLAALCFAHDHGAPYVRRAVVSNMMWGCMAKTIKDGMAGNLLGLLDSSLTVVVGYLQ